MLAVVEIAGKQFKVSENMKLAVPKLEANVGEKIKIEKVLLLDGDDAKAVGKSSIKGAFVEATVLAHDRDDKILVFRKKRRKNFKVTKGHRQEFTTIQIDSIKK